MHEYGGGQSIPIGNNGDTITSDFTTNKLVYTRYEAGLASSEFSITSEQNTAYRYADMCLDSLESNARNNSSRLMFAVREDHSVDEPAHVVNSIVVLSLDRATEVRHYRWDIFISSQLLTAPHASTVAKCAVYRHIH